LSGGGRRVSGNANGINETFGGLGGKNFIGKGRPEREKKCVPLMPSTGGGTEALVL